MGTRVDRIGGVWPHVDPCGQASIGTSEIRARRAAEGKPKPATSSGAAESVSLTPEQLLALSDAELDEWLMKNVGERMCNMNSFFARMPQLLRKVLRYD